LSHLPSALLVCGAVDASVGMPETVPRVPGARPQRQGIDIPVWHLSVHWVQGTQVTLPPGALPRRPCLATFSTSGGSSYAALSLCMSRSRIIAACLLRVKYALPTG